MSVEINKNTSHHFLKKWYRAKKKIEKLEKKISEYKIEIMNEMNRKGVEKISFEDYTVIRRRLSRSTVSKDVLPADLWKKYASACHFDTYHITKTS